MSADTSVTTVDWIALAAWVLVVGPLGLLAVRQMWRDDERWANPPGFWIAGDAQWRGLVRMTLPAVAAVGFALGLVPVFAFLDGREATGLSVLLVLAVLVLALGSACLAATTFLFNWPKALVPPPRRADPSYVRLGRRGGRSQNGVA